MSEQRIKGLTAQLCSTRSTNVVGNDSESLPLPPIVPLKDGQLFPTYPEVLEASKRYGGVFTYIIGNGKRMTFVTDKAAYRHVFYARDNKDVVLDSAKLAYHWFGIQKDLAREYTRPALDLTRQAMAYGKMKKTNNHVGEHALSKMRQMPVEGEDDLWNIAMLTFVPVVKHLFGKETFDSGKCPMIAEKLWKYDEDFKKVANGMPRKWFPEMEKTALELSDYFVQSIHKGIHLKPDAEINCPVLKARLELLDQNRFSAKDRGRFVFSVFWASQGNTIPGTFWMLALIASHPNVKERIVKEVRNRKLGPNDVGFYNFEDCEFVQACVKETLRLRVANVTLRNVINEVVVKTTDGQQFRVPKGDEITVSSYVQHHDDRIYERPKEFLPERWLGKGGEKFTDFDWFPFGAGTNKCSGRHLAQMELATIAALFFMYFDIELLDPVPEVEWKNVVAMCGPKKRSLKFKFKKVKSF